MSTKKVTITLTPSEVGDARKLSKIWNKGITGRDKENVSGYIASLINEKAKDSNK